MTATTFNITVGAPQTNFNFDFNSYTNVTQSGGTPAYIGVQPTPVYTATTGYGWLTSPSAIDRGTSSDSNAFTLPDLRRDFAYGTTATTFETDLPNGTYDVNFIIGDASYTRDLTQVVNATPGAGNAVVLSNIGVIPAGQWYTGMAQATAYGGKLELQFSLQSGTSQQAGTPIWLVNGLEIRPTGTEIPVSFTSSLGTVAADGTTVDTINGSTTAAQGTILTITSSLGTVLTDSSSTFVGNQVIVGAGGTFSFQLQRPANVTGTPTLTATAIDDSAYGTSTSVVSYTTPPPPTTRLFDFNTASSPTQSSYIGVAPAVYSSSVGYGWLTTPLAVDRGGPTNLLRDFAYGTKTTPDTFMDDIPNGTYTVTATVGDAGYLRDLIDIQSGTVSGGNFTGGSDVLGGNYISSAAGQFATRTFNVTVTNNQMALQFSEQPGASQQSGTPIWVVNGLTIRPQVTAFTLNPRAVQPARRRQFGDHLQRQRAQRHLHGQRHGRHHHQRGRRSQLCRHADCGQQRHTLLQCYLDHRRSRLSLGL